MNLKEAKLFQNGQSQAVRLPREFRMEGKSVYIKHFGEGVLLMPKESVWDIFEDGLDALDDDFKIDREQGMNQEREEIFVNTLYARHQHYHLS